MGTHEDDLLQSAALQNDASIVLARQRSKQELIRTKQMLEARTEALARALATTEASLKERDQAQRDAEAARAEVEALNAVGTTLASELDVERIVQTVTDAATKLTGAQFGAFFYNVVDEQGEKLTLYTLSGAPRSAFENFGHPRPTPIFAPTFYGTEPVVRSDDITKDPR